MGDPAWHYKVLGIHCDGANGSTTFSDVKSHTVTGESGAQISTAQYPALTGKNSSAYFDGSGCFLEVPDSGDWHFGGGDFTLRARVRFAGYASNNNGYYKQALISQDRSGDRAWGMLVSGTASSLDSLGFVGFTDSAHYTEVVGAYSFSLNTWYLVECCRVGDLVYLFVDGTPLNAGGTAFSRTIQNVTTTLKVGALNWDSTFLYHLNGYMSEVEIYKGAGLHTASYTPTTEPFADEYVSVSGTVKNSGGSFVARNVGVYRKDTGALVERVTSNGTTGAYKVIMANSGNLTPLTAFAVQHDDSGSENALVFDNVAPV